jgi:hypothetical protein
MILPVGAKNFEEAMQMGSETYHHLKVPSICFRESVDNNTMHTFLGICMFSSPIFGPSCYLTTQQCRKHSACMKPYVVCQLSNALFRVPALIYATRLFPRQSTENLKTWAVQRIQSFLYVQYCADESAYFHQRYSYE